VFVNGHGSMVGGRILSQVTNRAVHRFRKSIQSIRPSRPAWSQPSKSTLHSQVEISNSLVCQKAAFEHD